MKGIAQESVPKLLQRARQGEGGAYPKLARIAAQWLRSGDPMPVELADYVASALEESAEATATAKGSTVEEARVRALAHGLNIIPPANRPRTPLPDCEIAVASVLYGSQLSQTKIAKALAETAGISLRAAQYRVADAKSRVIAAENKIEAWWRSKAHV